MFSSLTLPSPTLPEVDGERDDEDESPFARSIDTARELPVNQTRTDERQEGLELAEEAMERQLAEGEDYIPNGSASGGGVGAIEKGIASTSLKAGTKDSSIHENGIVAAKQTPLVERSTAVGESSTL